MNTAGKTVLSTMVFQHHCFFSASLSVAGEKSEKNVKGSLISVVKHTKNLFWDLFENLAFPGKIFFWPDDKNSNLLDITEK